VNLAAFEVDHPIADFDEFHRGCLQK